MDIRYDEWLPVAEGLKGVVTAYWRVDGEASQVPSSAINRKGAPLRTVAPFVLVPNENGPAGSPQAFKKLKTYQSVIRPPPRCPVCRCYSGYALMERELVKLSRGLQNLYSPVRLRPAPPILCKKSSYRSASSEFTLAHKESRRLCGNHAVSTGIGRTKQHWPPDNFWQRASSI
jgi:hypothetical protein